MLKLGETQPLVVARKVDFGFYLAEKGTAAPEVLLPGSEIEEQTPVGTTLMVFLYKDSGDRLIATVKEPRLKLGEIGLLSVKEVTPIGAFLDWGLPKDLLLPFREQTGRVKKGKAYPVAVYIDKSRRLCATMRLYERLSSDSPYKQGDHVSGHIYELHERLGAFVAVADAYRGLILKQNCLGNEQAGDAVAARVTRVREDGSLTLSVREPAHLQMEADAEAILSAVRERGGTLRLTDHSSPEEIRRVLFMSKAAFKRGVGRLLKEEKITLSNEGIFLREASCHLPICTSIRNTVS